ncbi:hypothetical protein F7725_004111 [Dissostichus mawsoni]|uniref:RPA-interacting protein C-terminal domain-containing protein n=1 Tax=Dissostichus mawsoni TaxID=36200 RepID=A0A7J5YD16_DISMA|nr:hypothetical protein F7725_004111 [Dissostichus mawsoni]
MWSILCLTVEVLAVWSDVVDSVFDEQLEHRQPFVSCCCGLYINTKARVSEHMEDCLQNPVFSVAPPTDGSPSLMISCKRAQSLLGTDREASIDILHSIGKYNPHNTEIKKI